jgi:hypothetical protein
MTTHDSEATGETRVAADERRPVTEEPVTERRAADRPVRGEPLAEEPVAREPVAREPVAERPLVGAPVHQGLVTSVPAQRAAYGGIHFGAGFFGWLAAMGMALLLTALLAAAGTAVGVATGTTPSEAASKGAENVQTIGWAGAVVLAVLVFVSYFSGGYVAARMARFSGAKQGLAVWLWAVLAAVVLAVVAAVAGSKYDVLSQLNSFPRIPVSEGTLSNAGIVALVLVAVTSLVGALLGGAAGMGYHRRVDRAGAVDDVEAVEP